MRGLGGKTLDEIVTFRDNPLDEETADETMNAEGMFCKRFSLSDPYGMHNDCSAGKIKERGFSEDCKYWRKDNRNH